VKPVLRFAATAAVVFALLMAPWPGLRAGYAACFRTAGEISFSFFWRGGDVRFEPYEEPGREADTRVRVDEDAGPAWYTLVDSRGAGYLPLAVFLALLAATPIGRRRKALALVGGGLLVHGYVTLLLWINLLEGLTRHAAGCPAGAHAAWLQGPTWGHALETAIVLFRLEPTVFLAAPVLAWLVVCVRPDDLRRWARG